MFEPSFWSTWPKRTVPEQIETWISHEALQNEAKKAGYKGVKLNKTLDWLENGVELGCEGDARLQTISKNNQSALDFGVRITDALRGWVEDGICAGPLSMGELEAMGLGDLTINSMQVRLKPNGKARIIHDLSSPHHNEPQPPGTPVAVNRGIDKDKYPAKMANTKSVLETLEMVGQPAEFSKIDWQQAYKHLAVKLEDIKLQCLQWGGMVFMELKCTFGCVSSPGVFDVVSDTVKEISILNSSTKTENVLKCLDDVVNIDTKGTGRVEKFSREYQRLCSAVGIKLAEDDENDKEKCFNVSQHGTVLGVYYNLEEWTWKIPDAKAGAMAAQLRTIIEGKEVTNGLLQSVAGRIQHYAAIVFNGRWEKAFLVGLDNSEEKKTTKKRMRSWNKEQAEWWLTALTMGMKGTRIPSTRHFTSINVINCYSDAASEDNKSGAGGVLWVEGCKPWIQVKWPAWISRGGVNSLGDSFNHKLTTLEGFACVIALTAAPELVRGRTVRIHCDNSGFIFAYKKARSRCNYVSTISKCLHDVALGLDTKLEVVKARRLSTVGDEVADLLSKDRLPEAHKLMGDCEDRSRGCWRTMKTWIKNPVPSRSLGWRLLEEIGEKFPVLQYENSSRQKRKTE